MSTFASRLRRRVPVFLWVFTGFGLVWGAVAWTVELAGMTGYPVGWERIAALAAGPCMAAAGVVLIIQLYRRGDDSPPANL